MKWELPMPGHILSLRSIIVVTGETQPIEQRDQLPWQR